MNTPIIIGVTGLNGAGKSTLADRLKHIHGFAHLSFRDFLTQRLEQQDIDVNRENMRNLANELRKEHGSSYILEQLLNHASESEQPVVIESIRTVGEAQYLKQHGALLIAVVAPHTVRYERITRRGSVTDKVGYEEFVAAEEKESISQDHEIQNLPQVVEMANYVLTNEDLNDFEQSIDALVMEIQKNY